MVRTDAKSIKKGKIPDVNYLLVWDKAEGKDFADAINILAEMGWSIVQIWGLTSSHFGLFRRN
ncbi:MAG: hypothetical protein ACFFER_13285 [Candidatus Thorarchaeota archaeon]